MSRYFEEAAAYSKAAERWRAHALRSDSLGQTARRLHTKYLSRAWEAEALAVKYRAMPHPTA
ncbi:hypothetical protein [Streptomyces lydicus]|uniref:hypothetical protein n=1 Tax=Streptomyces lydicus TaxID=47763 RepID=UPI00378C6941